MLTYILTMWLIYRSSCDDDFIWMMAVLASIELVIEILILCPPK